MIQENLMGCHYILDINNADPDTLNDEEYLKELLEAAAIVSGCTVVQTISHKFSPQGVTAISLLAESHMSIHTWPERGEAAVDVFTCGDADCQYAGEFIVAAIGGRVHESNYVERHRPHEVANPFPIPVTYDTV